MLIYQHFHFTGAPQRWAVPEGVTEATFECWGASGGMPSSLHFEGRKGQVKGGTGPRNTYFYNGPYAQGQLGNSYANNAGYTRGVKSVAHGDIYHVYVGGNGGPGHSSIKLNMNGTSYTVGLRGGAGGWNGGGDGGKGAHVYQNLFDASSNKVHFKQATMPKAAKVGNLWYDTSANLVKKCNTAYSNNNGTAAKWDQVTHVHPHAVGPSGGGGGGATDIRLNGNDLSDRIMVAGGGGGAGGHWNKTGSAAWVLRSVPDKPNPPFGSDDSASGATGKDHTWATNINFLVGGWGRGGLGGGTGPNPHSTPTGNSGLATSGGGGGPATARHKDGDAPGRVHGSAGSGGTHVAGGARGSGGSGATGGSLGNGGTGADAAGGLDDWCAGGGGGGGGYYGGGGGGQGFKVSGKTNAGIGTRGGGGGGGSNYVAPSFTHPVLVGGARPPVAAKNFRTGANGHGGFARISYHKPPAVKWSSIPNAVLADSTYSASFTYIPAQDNGAGIDHYVIGTATDPNATFPTATTTVMVDKASTTDFTYTLTAPAAGVTNAVFVQVTDTDGDTSDWNKHKVTGLSSSDTSGEAITSPAANSTFSGSATVDWTLGTQTPLVAYRLGLTGNDLATNAVRGTQTGWRRGGSRVNLALDPGFVGSAVWSSTSNANLAPSTAHPGVSGSNGAITWDFADDFSAENHTTSLDNLLPGTAYRLHIEVASNLANDARPVEFQVWDNDGLLTSYTVDLSAVAAGTYVPVDLEFTPHTQGVYFMVLPSATSASGDPLLDLDFEDGTTGGATGAVVSDQTQANSGVYALKATGAGSVDPSASLSGAGTYLAEVWAYTPAASAVNGSLSVSGTGVTETVAGSTTTRDAWTLLRIPFTWDGVGTVALNFNGDATGTWYDDVTVSLADDASNAEFGNTDSGQVTYLANMLIELVYEEDGTDGYQTYFDGGHLNGNTGTASWSGSANASPSVLTGTNVVTDTLTYDGDPLNNGSLYLDTLAKTAVLDGFGGSEASVAVHVRPSLPATPTVTLTVDNGNGLMVLSIDAADSGATYKTTSFDIFRNGVRIAHGLTPDQSTRQATYTDAPGQGVAATYVVRAFDSQRGWVDQTDGTVVVN